MIRRPPRSTRTDTLFPYTTLFRSMLRTRHQCERPQRGDVAVHAEDAVGGDHRRALGMPPQLPDRALDVAVRIAAQAATGQPRGVDQAGVVEPVQIGRAYV